MDEHASLNGKLEMSSHVDQMCLPILVPREMMCRRYPLWEEVCGTALREAEGGSGVERIAWLDEREIFLGQKKRGRDGMLLPQGVAPAGPSAPAPCMCRPPPSHPGAPVLCCPGGGR